MQPNHGVRFERIGAWPGGRNPLRRHSALEHRFRAHLTHYPLGTAEGRGAAWNQTRLVSFNGHELLQLCVFGFGLFVDRDISVGVFPQGKKIQIRAARLRGVFQ